MTVLVIYVELNSNWTFVFKVLFKRNTDLAKNLQNKIFAHRVVAQ
jgi:hypothetical protein